MSYAIKQDFIPGLPKNPYRNGVSAYEGVIAHSTATPNATAAAERNYETGHWNDAFVHYFVDWTSIIQVADINYLCWGAGHTANQRYAQVELCETADSKLFAQSYARYTWLLAYILYGKRLGVKHQSTFFTHADTSALFKETDHTDPVGYLSSHGVSVDKLVADVTAEYNKMAGQAPAPSQPAAPSKLYRIRKSWADVKSQIGAFANLDSAKGVADQNKAQGYKVFEENGAIVYDPSQAPVAQPSNNALYRVRKDWADAKSQIGAFSNLDNAKALADENAGYKVFDEYGNVVYSPINIQPATPKADSQPAHPAPALGHPIMGTSSVSVDKMAAYVKSVNPNAVDIAAIAQAFIEVGTKYGVRGDVAFCQSIIETGYFKFDGGTVVTADQHNYCGMGVTSKGVKGNSFDTVKDGVTAQMQHLFAYASKLPLPEQNVLDPRFQYVTRGIAPSWEDLNNHWAMNSNYGQEILAKYDELVNFVYVPPFESTEKPIETPVVPTTVVPPKVDISVAPNITKDENKLNWFSKFIDYIVKAIKALLGK